MVNYPLMNEEVTKPSLRKRLFDICFSLVVLVCCFPLFCLIALLVGFTSKGLVIYGHERIGRNGRTFRCYKFRTMYSDAEERLNEIFRQDPLLKEEWTSTHKLKQDPRVTSIGLFLRKTSLDELPQFWNVLKGDLSVVGPRPMVKVELERHLGRKAPVILSVKPGLTGLWQVSGRSNTSYAERIRLDEEYIQNQSLLMDFKLILKTIPAIFSSRGAF